MERKIIHAELGIGTGSVVCVGCICTGVCARVVVGTVVFELVGGVGSIVGVGTEDTENIEVGTEQVSPSLTSESLRSPVDRHWAAWLQ